MTVSDQIQIVRREIALRERVYPRQVAASKMTQKEADHQLGGMRSVLATLEACQYHDTIPEGGVRLELRGLKNGKLHGYVIVFYAVNNDTLLISSCRDAALRFWKFFGRE